MRRLFPDVADEDPDRTYAALWAGHGGAESEQRRANVALGMVASVDGGASVDGRTDALGGEGDRIAFTRLREACDVILVGAQTVRAEGYGPPVGDGARRRRRRERGLAPVPQLAILSRRLDLDPTARVFAQAEPAPLILTTEHAAAGAPPELRAVAEIVGLGTGSVDLHRAVTWLAHRGLTRVLCEGGPSLAAQLLTADLVDEVFLTIHPVALAGQAPRIAVGVAPATPRGLELIELREHEGELLLRYAVQRTTRAGRTVR